MSREQFLEQTWRQDLEALAMQDQDNPSSYSNHTCEVKGSYHKRQHEDSDSSQPQKRQRGSESESSSLDKQAACKGRHASLQHVGANSRAMQSDEPRINPIDHIFQFHKVYSKFIWPEASAENKGFVLPP